MGLRLVVGWAQVSYRVDGSAIVSFNDSAAGLVLGRNGGVKPFMKQVSTPSQG